MANPLTAGERNQLLRKIDQYLKEIIATVDDIDDQPGPIEYLYYEMRDDYQNFSDMVRLHTTLSIFIVLNSRLWYVTKMPCLI